MDEKLFFTPEVLNTVQDALQKEFGTAVTLKLEGTSFIMNVSKEAGLEDKLQIIADRLSELLKLEHGKIYFQKDCVVYLVCEEIKGNTVVIQMGGHQLLSDAALVGRAYTEFDALLNSGYVDAEGTQVHLKSLRDIHIARSVEQALAIEADLNVLLLKNVVQ